MIRNYIEKIDRYFVRADDTQPLLIDFNNKQMLNEFIQHYNVGAYNFIKAAECCREDEILNIVDLFHKLKTSSNPTFLVNISAYLHLLGEKEAKNILKDLMSNNHQKLVIVGYQICSYLGEITDPRLKNRMVLVENDRTDKLPEIYFCEDSDYFENKNVINGINLLGAELENSSQLLTVYVKTKKNKSDFPYSCLKIQNLKNSFDILGKVYNYTIEEKLGTQIQWDFLLKELKKHKTLENIIKNHFGNVDILDNYIAQFKDWSKEKKWLYYISIKVYHCHNKILNNVIKVSDNISDFIRGIYRYLIDNVETSDTEFWNKYQEWKNLRKYLYDNVEIKNYCDYIKHKEEKTIYYLTDISDIEKELIFEQLNKYKDNYTDDKKSYENLVNILRHIYPKIGFYLSDYRFDDSNYDFTTYFRKYKYQKIINTIFNSFKEEVNRLANERIYNRFIIPRTAKVESIDKEKTCLYFLDAMGVEYLGYINKLCEQKDLQTNIIVCSANLPTVTSENKEFIDVFEKAGIKCNKVSTLDEIKHKDSGNYDYQKTKLPIHLIKELECIENVIDKISAKLETNECLKAVIISDHGASRLAVINESTLNIDTEYSKGEHSGRICKYNEQITNIPNATKENDYYILADYSRFKGGRAANVEVHGGATLEEVLVPIIEITKLKREIELKILTPEIIVSYRKKAQIKIFATSKVNNISICIKDKQYFPTLVEETTYVFDLPDITKSGLYRVEVFTNNNLLNSGLSFNVKKEGSQENDLL